MSEILTEALRAWAEKNNISPAEFGRRMGYTYAHAHGLLRGERRATMETLGRLHLVYGDEAAEVSAAVKAAYPPVSSLKGRGGSEYGDEAEDLLVHG